MPTIPLDLKTFRLDRRCETRPTLFEIHFKIRGRLFAYGFDVLENKIQQEWLFDTGPYSEKEIYRRTTEQDGRVTMTFGSWVDKLDKEQRDFLRFVALGTRPNQLFLRETGDRNVPWFADVREWFQDRLVIITPETIPVGLELRMESEEKFASFMQRLTKAAGMGISRIHSEEISISALDKEARETLSRALEPGEMCYIGQRNHRFCIAKNTAGELTVKRLGTFHRNQVTGEEHLFEMSEESDGTRRFIDLASALYELTLRQEMVYIIDEMGRSLHPALVAFILEHHLERNRAKNNQLIFTTHDSTLLDLKKLRRGEIWFTEKNPEGATEMFSMLEYKKNIRYDKDIQKAYREGRYGGVPHLTSWLKEA